MNNNAFIFPHFIIKQIFRKGSPLGKERSARREDEAKYSKRMCRF